MLGLAVRKGQIDVIKHLVTKCSVSGNGKQSVFVSSAHTHTHTHTLTHAHTKTHPHTRTHAHTHTPMHACTFMIALTHYSHRFQLCHQFLAVILLGQNVIMS